MKEIQQLNPLAHQFLMDKDPKTWSKAYYETGRCCDVVENGMSECFNAILTEARKKPIITMLEEIRLYMMERLYNLKMKGQAWGNEICPKIRGKLNELKKKQRCTQVLPSGLNQFEVRGTGDAFEVDLERKTCSCRLWQLNGYGCLHSVACISYLNRDVEAYVDERFNTTTYMKAYTQRICGMNGVAMWPETSYTPPLPPKSRRMPGRPTIKRKRDATETRSTHTVSKVGKTMHCSNCKEAGHNKRKCQKEVTEEEVVRNNNEAERKVKMVQVKRRKLSERIMKLKLGKKIDGEGSSEGQPMDLE